MGLRLRDRVPSPASAPEAQVTADEHFRTVADATGLQRNALIASGLVLFVITFVVNFSARAIVARNEPGRAS